MSYRNPKIIDDKSGQVLGQAIAQGAQNISKGIIGMEAQNRAAKEKKEKKEKEDRDKLILDNKRTNALRSNFNQSRFKYEESIKKTFSGFRDTLTGWHEAANEAQFDIAVEGQVKGVGGKNFNDKQKGVYEDINGLNSLTSDLIGVSGAFKKWVDAGNSFDESMFWKSYDMDDGTGKMVSDGGSRTKAIGMALGGVDGYGAKLEKGTEGSIYLVVTNPDGESMQISQAEFSTMSQEMFLEKKDNITTSQIDSQTKSFLRTNPATKKTEFQPQFAEGKPTEVSVINGKKLDTYQRQILNKGTIDEERDLLVSSTTDRLIGVIDQPQLRDKYLVELGIDPDVFNSIEEKGGTKQETKQAQREFLGLAALKIYDKTKGFKYDRESEQYYFDQKISSTSVTDDESIAQQEFSYYTNAFETAGTNIKEDITNIFEIGGGREIKMGTSRYYPFDMTVNNSGVVTVTRTGKLAMGGAPGDIKGGTDTDKKDYNMKDKVDVLNFIYATTPLLPADARALRDQIIAKYN